MVCGYCVLLWWVDCFLGDLFDGGCCAATLVDLVVSLLSCCICGCVGGVSGWCCCVEVILVMVCLGRCITLIVLLYCMV